ncbi:MAG: hypothetical protein ACHP79_08970 [Terriglobales bacterium]
MTEAEVKSGAGRGVVAAPVAAPIAAMVSSLTTLACCLPAGFLAAAGAAGGGVFFQRFRSGLLALSVVFLVLGFWQQWRGVQCGLKPGRWTRTLLWIAAAIVLLVLLFPQEIAGFFADRLGPGTR